MKQEKKPTLWVDLESRLQPWQEQTLSRINRGVKKGEPIVIYGAGRKSGKSQMAAMYMAGMGGMGGTTTVFWPPWDEWEDVFVWPWNAKTSIESKKKIWGRIKVRYNKIVWESGGRQKQYATKKEVFQRKLRGADSI